MRIQKTFKFFVCGFQRYFEKINFINTKANLEIKNKSPKEFAFTDQ